MAHRSTISQLLDLLRRPKTLVELAPPDWNRIIPLVRKERLLARLGVIAESNGIHDQLPAAVHDLCQGSRVRSEYLRRQGLLLAKEISELLKDNGIPLLLLKGVAYAAADLEFARGRMFSDLDVLVPVERLSDAEKTLQARGWEIEEMDRADQRYYREWMHELPPMKNPGAQLELDVHHNLVPPVSRIKLDIAPFWQQAQAVQAHDLSVLSPPHMLIHSAAHLFFNDELRGGLRELLDIDGLCRLAPITAEFWSDVVGVAVTQPMLARTLFYALDTAHRLLDTPVAAEFWQELAPWTPGFAHLRTMRWLFTRPLLDDGGWPAEVASQALFVRSHWLRLPANLLVPHLMRKAGIRLQEAFKRT